MGNKILKSIFERKSRMYFCYYGYTTEVYVFYLHIYFVDCISYKGGVRQDLVVNEQQIIYRYNQYLTILDQEPIIQLPPSSTLSLDAAHHNKNTDSRLWEEIEFSPVYNFLHTNAYIKRKVSVH